ncbi:3528_t:CDS:2 [Dentiscutata erythropus]|uniref:3528_t:CDS:1 n=1 Tax=Dentiscutata erythropus TaxID=1348616 RepID=A0A9N9CDG8_9GLOM|nr:3528_t:CDS:2 [Dentiscutata erythropus]
MDEVQGKRVKTHDTRSKSINKGENINIIQESPITRINTEQGQELIVATSNNKSIDWSEDVDLEFSVGEDPTDTSSSNSDETENSSGNEKELSGKIMESSDIMNIDMQNDNLNQDLGGTTPISEKKVIRTQKYKETTESITYSENNPYLSEGIQDSSIESSTDNRELASEENERNSEQVTNKTVVNDRPNKQVQDTLNLPHTSEGEEGKIVDVLNNELVETSGSEDVGQVHKEDVDMELIAEMMINSKQAVNEEGFIQVTSKRNRKKTSTLVADKRISPYGKNKDAKKGRASSGK